MLAFVAGNLQKRNHSPFDQPPLRMTFKNLGQNLKGALARAGGDGGGGAQMNLEMVELRVVFGTAPTTVSTFSPPLKIISVGMLRMPY